MAAFDFIAVCRTHVNCTAPKFSKKLLSLCWKAGASEELKPYPLLFPLCFLFWFFDKNVLLVFCVSGAEWFRKVEKRDAVHCVCEWGKYRRMWCGVDCGGVQRFVFTVCRSSSLLGVGGWDGGCLSKIVQTGVGVNFVVVHGTAHFSTTRQTVFLLVSLDWMGQWVGWCVCWGVVWEFGITGMSKRVDRCLSSNPVLEFGCHQFFSPQGKDGINTITTNSVSVFLSPSLFVCLIETLHVDTAVRGKKFPSNCLVYLLHKLFHCHIQLPGSS